MSDTVHNLLTVRNTQSDATALYIDGKRVSAKAYREIGAKAERFDCFQTETRGALVRQRVCAYMGN
jgi:hypothetical protein